MCARVRDSGDANRKALHGAIRMEKGALTGANALSILLQGDSAGILENSITRLAYGVHTFGRHCNGVSVQRAA